MFKTSIWLLCVMLARGKLEFIKLSSLSDFYRSKVLGRHDVCSDKKDEDLWGFAPRRWYGNTNFSLPLLKCTFNATECQACIACLTKFTKR